MVKRSAGILLYGCSEGAVRVLLAHPGGPFWQRRDDGAWSIPKGEINPGEATEAAARREFGEELGPCPPGPLQPLGALRQKGGKWVEAFALEGDFDTSTVLGGAFEMEWPPRSGRIVTFPEVDKAEWFTLTEAQDKILASQRPFLDRLEALLGIAKAPP